MIHRSMVSRDRYSQGIVGDWAGFNSVADVVTRDRS